MGRFEAGRWQFPENEYFFLEKSLGRKELGGIFPKMLQVGHFPDIHEVTCPKLKGFFSDCK